MDDEITYNDNSELEYTGDYQDEILDKEDLEKAQINHTLFLNKTGFEELGKLGIIKELVLALTREDFQVLKDRNIYFLPMLSPASKSNLKSSIPIGSQIISLDINSLKKLSSRQAVSVVLHEIGHAMNPELKNEEGEFAADDYAKIRGYGEECATTLEIFKRESKEEFDKPLTDDRIKKLRDIT